MSLCNRNSDKTSQYTPFVTTYSSLISSDREFLFHGKDLAEPVR